MNNTKLATQFRKYADNLQRKADEIRNRDFKPNTVSRANMMASALQEADRLEAIATKMRALADAAEAGTLPETLRNVRTKAQVEELYNSLDKAKWDAIYANAAQDDGKPVTADQIMQYALPPRATLTHDHIKMLLKWTEGEKGIANARKRLERLLATYQEPVPVGSYLNDIEKLIKVAEKKHKGNKDVATYLIKDRLNSAKRLASIFNGRMPTVEEYRKLLVDFLKLGGHVEGKTLDRKIKEMELELVGRDIPGYFPTPKPVVEKMLEKADIQPGMKVLEPSAGKGNIADAIKEKHPDTVLEVVEYQQVLRDILEAKGHKLVGVDFLKYNVGQYDRILMNPPFEHGQDIDHVRHAYELLKPGGRLVAIMCEGSFNRSDRKATEFREWLASVDGWSEKLPDGAFKDSERPTGVATRLVVIDKPLENLEADAA